MNRLQSSILRVVAILPLIDVGVVFAYFVTINQQAGLGGAFLMAGALPFANILAVVYLIGLHHPGNGFLKGFGAFGTVALTFYFLDYLCGFPFFINIYMKDIGGTTVFYRPELWIPFLLLPQLAFAILGGLLFMLTGWFLRQTTPKLDG